MKKRAARHKQKGGILKVPAKCMRFFRTVRIFYHRRRIRAALRGLVDMRIVVHCGNFPQDLFVPLYLNCIRLLIAIAGRWRVELSSAQTTPGLMASCLWFYEGRLVNRLAIILTSPESGEMIFSSLERYSSNQ